MDIAEVIPVVPIVAKIVPVVAEIIPVVPVTPVAPGDLVRVGLVARYAAIVDGFDQTIEDCLRTIQPRAEIAGWLHALLSGGGMSENKCSKEAEASREHVASRRPSP
jgi:hypothetical protein